MLICISENMNQITTKSHVFLKKIPKQKLKYVVSENIIYGFLFQVLITLPILPQTLCLIILLWFL